MISEASAIAAASKVFDKVPPALLESIGKRVKRASDVIRARYTLTFQSHLAKTLARVLYVKTVVSKDQPVDLQTI